MGESNKPRLQNCLPVQVTVYGMSQFYNRAIFAKVEVNKELKTFSSTLEEILLSNNVDIRNDHEDFNPHVTVIKVKRPERRLFGNRNIKQSWYSDFTDTDHGVQGVS